MPDATGVPDVYSDVITRDFEVEEHDGQAWVTLDTAILWEEAHARAGQSLHGSSRLPRRRLRLFRAAGTRATSAVSPAVGTQGSSTIHQRSVA